MKSLSDGSVEIYKVAETIPFKFMGLRIFVPC